MMTTPLRCASVLVLIGFALALDPQLSAQTSIRLEIVQTSAGPIVRGMFSSFETFATAYGRSVRHLPLPCRFKQPRVLRYAQ